MSKKEMITGLIANEATQLTENDRPWLDALHEDQLTLMAPVINEVKPPEPCCPDEVAALIANEESVFTADDADFLNTLTTEQLVKVTPVKVTVNDDDDNKPTTMEAYIDAAPDEMKDVLKSGAEMHRNKKKEIVDGILANKRNKFTAEDLTAKPMSELEAIAELAHTPDFSGRGGQEPHSNEGENKEEALETPTINWDERK